MRILALLVAFALSATGASGQSETLKAKLDGIDDELEKVLDTWSAPGFAVAVVDQDGVIYEKGFGYSDFENKIAATENSLYAIGSCSKAFTTSLLGILRAEEKLTFEDSPRDYIPELRFFNEQLDNMVTIKDIMTHRTGLPRHDFSWYLFPTRSRDTLIMRMEYQEPFADVRSQWYYNNFMYLTQGVIAERLTEMSWEDNVREKLLKPLGMTNSTVTIQEMKDHPAAAIGYQLKQDSIIDRMDYYDIAAMSPAGSINSSVHEMANWVMTWINGGTFGGEEILPSEFVKEAISPQMLVSNGMPGQDEPGIQFATYGYGWFMNSYKGHYRVQHGGNIDGFSANTCFFPLDSVGIIVLTNQNGSSVPSVVRNIIADRLLDIPYKDWNTVLKEERDEAIAKQKEAQESSGSARIEGTSPSHLLAEYTGVYSHPGYGEFNIAVRNDSLFADFALRTIWLKHYHYDVFEPFLYESGELDSTNSPQFKVNFSTNDAGDISGVKMPFEPTVDPLEFRRTPNTIELSKEDLEKYTGAFELAGQTATIFLKDDNDNLFLSIAGQPDYELLATGVHSFAIRVLDGFKLQFSENDEGIVDKVKFVQPNGVFEATRKEDGE